MSKIFFTCASLQSGGAERVLSVLSPKLVEHYEEVQYILWYEAPVFYTIDRRVKLVSIEKESGSKSTSKRMKWFRKYIKEQKPDLILSFSAPFNMLTLASLLFTGNKVIACERVDPRSFRWGKLLEFFRNLLYYTADGILTQTQLSKDYFKGNLYKKTDIIFNPITMGADIVGSAVYTPKQKIIVTAARLAKQKRQDLLIACFAKFKIRYPEYRLIIYGEGSEKDRLLALAENLEVSGNISMIGNVMDLWERIKSANMFVMTSLFEGMSNSMIEAMCLGIPTISTKVSGATDLIKNDENGLLIEVDDEEALYDSMVKIADDDAFAKTLGINASKLYDYLNVESISAQWIKYIDRKLKQE